VEPSQFRPLVLNLQKFVLDEPRKHIIELIQDGFGVLRSDCGTVFASRYLEVDLLPGLVGELPVLDRSLRCRDIDRIDERFVSSQRPNHRERRSHAERVDVSVFTDRLAEGSNRLNLGTQTLERLQATERKVRKLVVERPMCLILAATRRLEDRHQNISLKSRSTSPSSR